MTRHTEGGSIRHSQCGSRGAGTRVTLVPTNKRDKKKPSSAVTKFKAEKIFSSAIENT
jgi:hypothetical protein